MVDNIESLFKFMEISESFASGFLKVKVSWIMSDMQHANKNETDS